MISFSRDDCVTMEQYWYENYYKGREGSLILWRDGERMLKKGRSPLSPLA